MLGRVPPPATPRVDPTGKTRRWGRITNALTPAIRQISGRSRDPLRVAVSYVILRNGIGVLGFAFPIVMVAGGGLDQIQSSLSAYYHFSEAQPGQYGAGTMRDLFVGMLCAIGAFLFFYRGHSLQEDVALNVAGIAAVLVALLPMDWPADQALGPTTTATLHSASAAVFFIMIAYVCVFRGQDTLCIMPDPRRRRLFKRIYLALGILMLGTPCAIAALTFMLPAARTHHAVILIEAGGVFLFAGFWLVKGLEISSSVRLDRDPSGQPLCRRQSTGHPSPSGSSK